MLDSINTFLVTIPLTSINRVASCWLLNITWDDAPGFNYHSLLMGKPRGGNYHWIDNHLVKATRYNGKFTDLVEKEVTIEVFDDGQHD